MEKKIDMLCFGNGSIHQMVKGRDELYGRCFEIKEEQQRKRKCRRQGLVFFKAGYSRERPAVSNCQPFCFNF
ncbi:conserved hypothetical protein [Ricinus communis]|uniref:Uncharacterized protein n=1 Tax=Ricinus communis TaxID=3988 RepID=B9T484_RICCO|nr:conserved hypothetical protein [Ricinus communis]